MTDAPTDVQIAELSSERLDEAASLLARVFRDEPNFADLFPAEGSRDRALAPLFRAGCADALRHGQVQAALVGSQLVGVAVWLPPGAFPLSAGRALRGVPDTVRMLAAAPRALPRLVRFLGGAARYRPAEPFWYLQALGVDPVAQRRGVGQRLLAPVLARADATGERCYLETQTERNAAWYGRLGFEVQAVAVAFRPGGPPNWTMLRPPSPPRGGA